MSGDSLSDPRLEAVAAAIFLREMRDFLEPGEGWGTLSFESTREVWREIATTALAAADAVDPLRQFTLKTD